MTRILLLAALLSAAEYRLKWDDLPALATGKRVSIRLPDGSRVKGKVVAVTREDISVEARGRHVTAVPRAAVKQMDLARGKGYTWRVIGATIMGGVGLAVGVPVMVYAEEAWIGALVAAGSPAIGWLIGWPPDTRVALHSHRRLMPRYSRLMRMSLNSVHFPGACACSSMGPSSTFSSLSYSSTVSPLIRTIT